MGQLSPSGLARCTRSWCVRPVRGWSSSSDVVGVADMREYWVMASLPRMKSTICRGRSSMLGMRGSEMVPEGELGCPSTMAM